MEEFETWSIDFNLDSKTKDISTLLVSSVQVRALQTKLVSLLLHCVGGSWSETEFL